MCHGRRSTSAQGRRTWAAIGLMPNPNLGDKLHGELDAKNEIGRQPETSSHFRRFPL